MIFFLDSLNTFYFLSVVSSTSHIIYQGVIGTVIEYFSGAYPAWPTYLCKLAVLGTKAARSVVADFNPLW